MKVPEEASPYEIRELAEQQGPLLLLISKHIHYIINLFLLSLLFPTEA